MSRTNRKRRDLHKMTLAALFTVGNSLLRFPWRDATAHTPFFFLIFVCVTLIPAFFLYPLFRRLFRAPLSRCPYKKPLAILAAILLGALALFFAWRSFADYLAYAVEMILPSGSRLPLAIGFLLCVAWLSRLSDKGMDSFSLLCFLGVAVGALALFFFGIPHYRAEYLRLSAPTEEITRLILALLRESLLPLTVLSAYFALVVPKNGERSLAIGTTVGSGILLICVLQTLFTFGARYAAELLYPYSFSVRIISIGPYFFRLEGIAYLIDYSTCLMRASICLALVRRLFARFLPRGAGGTSIVCSIALLGFFCLH